MSDNTYRVDTVTGQDTVMSLRDGAWAPIQQRAKETFSFDGTDLVRTISKRKRVIRETYVDSDNDGIYTRSDADNLTGQPDDSPRLPGLRTSTDGGSKRGNRKSRRALAAPTLGTADTPAAGAVSPINGYDDDADESDDDDLRDHEGLSSSRYHESDDDEFEDDSEHDDDAYDDLYRVTIVGNTVQTVEEYDDGYWKIEEIDSGESWTVNSDGTVIKRENGRYGFETKTFTPFISTLGNNIFAETNEYFTPYSSQLPSLIAQPV